MNIVPAPKTDPIKAVFVTEAESLLATAVEQGDFDKGFAVINELYEHAEVSVQVIGAGLELMESNWDKFEHDGESFLSAAVRKTSLKPVTIQNQIKVRKFLNSGKIPETYLEAISELGQKSLVRLANTANSGFAIDAEDWEKFVTAVSNPQVEAIAREIEGKEPRSNFVGLYYRKNGELLAFVDGELVVIGEVLMAKDPKVIKGRETLIARAKILDKVEY